jgi:hypothetical protein
MEIKRFSEVLISAIVGDSEAVEAILARYMPLINKHSSIDGRFDEDMRQYIIMRVILQISNFKKYFS